MSYKEVKIPPNAIYKTLPGYVGRRIFVTLKPEQETIEGQLIAASSDPTKRDFYVDVRNGEIQELNYDQLLFFEVSTSIIDKLKGTAYRARKQNPVVEHRNQMRKRRAQ